MRFSVPLFPYDRWGGVDPLADAIVRADELGFWGVSLPEHLVMPVKEGVEPISVVWYENFVLASMLAARTQRIRLVFNALVLPYRNPIEVGKLIATLDQVSHGRVVITAGTGWMRREFTALGIPYEDRGSRTDDMIRALKVMWTTRQPSYDGPLVAFPPVHFQPTCVQSPHVPIWIGGSGPRPFRRAVELGDGWIPLAGTFDEVAASVAAVRDALVDAGRDPRGFTFGFSVNFGEPDAQSDAAGEHLAHGRARDARRATSAQETIDAVGRAVAAGINHLGVQFAWRTPAEYVEKLERFAAEVMPAVSTS